MKKFHYLLSASLILALLAKSAHAEDVAKPLAFNEVNEQLLQNYTNAKEEIRHSLGPLILCAHTEVTLIKGKERKAVGFVKPRYTGLKEVSHVTLGTFVLLTNHTDEQLSDELLEKLRRYRTGIEKAAKELKSNEGLDKNENFARQEFLIKKTLDLLSLAIEQKRVSHQELQNYARATASDDMQNVYDAASVQLKVIDEAVAKWRKEMTADEWNKLYVVIITPHMPRQKLLAYQYFAKLLKQTQEGDRIIVAEEPATEEQAMDLLLTHILDKKIGVDFFNDAWRMHRDLLSDAAAKWLKTNKLESAK